MEISFNPLWKTLIDRGWKKAELMEKAKLSKSTFAKILHNESVTLDTIRRICEALSCTIYDVVEIR